MRRLALLLLFCGLLAPQATTQQAPATPVFKVAETDLASLRAALPELSAKLRPLASHPQFADVAIYEKSVRWLLAHPEEFYTADYVRFAREALQTGLARAAELEQGKPSWTRQTGRVPRAYVSRIDDSVQPYRLTIPASYDGTKPVRLDVILHGRSNRLTEANFVAVDPKAKPIPGEQDWIELEVYGRGNNAYRWSGETDVFEALQAVVSQYKVDPDRILLRGFSMGGAGAWHIGLHHPSRWAGVEAGAGFNETIRYAKRSNLATYERSAVHVYDAVDYAVNTVNVPTVGYAGELDPQLAASKNIQEALEFEHVKPPVLFLIGPKTEHRWHPDSKKESESFLQEHLPRRMPADFRFVTWTPRYGRIWNWKIAALEQTYGRAEISGTKSNVKTRNVAELELESAGSVTIDGQTLQGKAFVKDLNRWSVRPAKPLLRKRAGLQGPIDDAFMDRFLCVAVGDSPALEEFAVNFHKQLRGELRRKGPDQVTKQDMAESHLVLFGTPKTNKLIAKVLKDLPVKWTDREIEIKGQRFDAATHTLVLIQPNPLNPSKYVVLNSGHTFKKADFEGTNALLYPRMGDYAVLETATGAVKLAGLFDEYWR